MLKPGFRAIYLAFTFCIMVEGNRRDYLSMMLSPSKVISWEESKIWIWGYFLDNFILEIFFTVTQCVIIALLARSGVHFML